MSIMSEQDAATFRAAFTQWIDDGWSPRLYHNGKNGYLIVFEKNGKTHAIGKAYHG